MGVFGSGVAVMAVALVARMSAALVPVAIITVVAIFLIPLPVSVLIARSSKPDSVSVLAKAPLLKVLLCSFAVCLVGIEQPFKLVSPSIHLRAKNLCVRKRLTDRGCWVMAVAVQEGSYVR